MTKNIKERLDHIVPDHITLTHSKKSKILAEAGHHINHKRGEAKRSIIPVLSVLFIIIVTGISAAAFIQQHEQESALQAVLNKDLKAVTIPGIDYSQLITSQYIDDTNELVYINDDEIYAYSTENQEIQRLVASNENAQINNFTANQNWLIWEDIHSNTLHVLNRHTQEQDVYHHSSASIQLADDYLITNRFDSFPGYSIIHLPTKETKNVHRQTGLGANSMAGILGEYLVIPERFQEGSSKLTRFFLYNIKSGKLLEEYTLPYEQAENITITEEKIYAQLSNSDEPYILGYIDLESGKYHKLDVPAFDAYAVHHNYLALSIPDKKGSNTVELFKLEEKSTKPIRAFADIEERLVKPRFTGNGTLVVNSESTYFSMYLLDVNNLNEK
ncbi:hypothetical protein [Bacillus mesophilum]|uniref:Uncharacterized protein n=1 Tax=Bacillus mesophilum TaxID=1071718 RepID=A0A7V7UUD2_9BACI|nr:hypothetical protein [Bacillus mesophilum]KAB2331765.1 hypothetical protein F7732_13915 [Bacillus mesophilum]